LTKAGFWKVSLKAAAVALIAFTTGSGVVAQTLAACGGYCEARQTRAICHRALARQDLKAHERDAEFEKCKANPLGYLAGPVRDETQIGFE
jgi:hypothetical protein